MKKFKISEKLTELRGVKGVTQAELAEAVGVSDNKIRGESYVKG